MTTDNMAEIVTFSKMNGEYAAALKELKRRKEAGETARKYALEVSDDELQSNADAFRASHDLTSADQTMGWLSDRGINLDDFEAFLEEGLLLHKASELVGGRESYPSNRDDDRTTGTKATATSSDEEKTKTKMMVQIHLTDACNLRCLHCYHGNDHDYTFMTGDQVDYVLDKVDGYMERKGFVPGRTTFCGGEPTLSPILFDSIRKFRDRGYGPISVLTNGLKIDAAFAKSLRDAGCTSTQICIEGNRETHNQIRCGTFDKVLNAWRICLEEGVGVHNQTTLSPTNLSQIPEIIDICLDSKIDRTSFLRAIPHNKEMGVLTDKQWFDTLDYFFRLKMHFGIAFDKFVNVRDIHWNTFFQNRPYNCVLRGQGFHNTITVESNGDIINCRRSGIVQGNIFTSDIEYPHTDSEVVLKTKNQKQNALCAACDNYSLCGGGCVGVANAMTGDPCTRDPQCIRTFINDEYWLNLAKDNDKAPYLSFGLSDDTAAEEREIIRYLWLSGRGDRVGEVLTGLKDRASLAMAEGRRVTESGMLKAFPRFNTGDDKFVPGGSATVGLLRDFRIPLDGFMKLYEMLLLLDPDYSDVD